MTQTDEGMNRAGQSTGGEVRRVRFDDEAVSPLLVGLGEEYAARYGAIDELKHTTVEEFEPPDGAFFVVVVDGETVAGGGFRRLTHETCEIKRVWTSPAHRRRGLAGVVLDAIEAVAADAGYRVAWLETGPSQPEAVAFYEGRGYRPIPLYNPRYKEALAFGRPLEQRPAGSDPPYASQETEEA
ncbi:MAG: GNAT family N-acetyltransferase [Acidimicrobiales bacterium]